MTTRVIVTIVAWNGLRYLKELLPSMDAQTFRDFQLIIIDNGSTDGTLEWLRANHSRITLLRNTRNIGFGPGHNQGIRYALDHWKEAPLADRYILTLNQDSILAPAFLDRLVAEAEAHPEAASFGGKLLRAFGENLHDEVMRETVKSDMIDTTGLTAHRNRTFTERGAGEMDTGQYNEAGEVFGLCAAACLYRVSALVEAKYKEEYYDHDFFAYKEDVDLAWRLRLLGWGARYVPGAVGYHYRGAYGKEQMGWRERLKNRRGKAQERNFVSTRNHWNLLMKNELFVNVFLALPFIAFSEIRRILFVCLFEPRTIPAFFQAIGRVPTMARKRRSIMRRKRVTAIDLRKWFI